MPNWVAFINGDNIIATGRTEEECIENARAEGYDRDDFSVMEGSRFFG